MEMVFGLVADPHPQSLRGIVSGEDHSRDRNKDMRTLARGMIRRIRTDDDCTTQICTSCHVWKNVEEFSGEQGSERASESNLAMKAAVGCGRLGDL